MNEITIFDELGIQPEYIEKLLKNEIKEPTKVQAQVIPEINDGKSVLFQSETGTGKTLAYLLPLIQKFEKLENPKREMKLLVIAPTVELASQIKTQAQLISNQKVMLLVGGASIKRQVETLKEKPLVVIGGPARLLELFHLKKLKLEGTQAIVLDEVDRLLSPELRDETLELVNALKKDVQLIACSATLTKSTRQILQETRVKSNGETESDLETIFLPQEDILRKKITHIAIFSETRDKIDTLRKFLVGEKPEKTLIFTSKIDQVANIVVKLKYKNIECEGLHGKTDKIERKSIIDRFKSGKISVLVTSDLTSRGLDIPNITHIVQMDLPSNDDFFIHRAGRTARAGKTGVNIVIGDEYEMRKFATLEKKLKITVNPRMLYKGKLTDPKDLTPEN